MKKGLRVIGNLSGYLLIIIGYLSMAGIYVYSRWGNELQYTTPIILGVAFLTIAITWIMGLLKGRGNSVLYPILLLGIFGAFIVSMV